MEKKQDIGASLRDRATHEQSQQAVSAVPVAIPSAVLEEAIALACEFHKGQVDKGGQPYILHPLRVMLALKGNPDTAYRIAAVLHDAVEDGDLEIALVKQRFGEEVARAVDALSRRRGEEYATFVERCALNPIARRVKLADIEDNLDLDRLGRTPTAKDIARAHKYLAARQTLLSAHYAAQGIAAGTDETAQQAQPGGQEPGPKDAPEPSASIPAKQGE